MQTLFYRWIGLGLLTGVFCGCSEKVENVEKKVVVEEEDPFSGNIAGVDPFSGNKEVVDEQIAEEVEVDPIEAIIADKLSRIMIPRLDFEDRTVEEALDYIRLRIVELDHTESEFPRKGVSMVIRRPKGNALEGGEAPAVGELGAGEDLLGGGIESADAKRIPELRVRNVSVAAALRYICLMTDIRCEVDECLTFSPRDPKAPWNSFGKVIEEKGDTSALSARLSQIILPRIDFENRSINEAIDFLRLKSAEMETDRKINFVVYIPKGMETPYIDKLQMSDSSFEEVLKEICAKTGMRYELDPYSVILVPKDLK